MSLQRPPQAREDVRPKNRNYETLLDSTCNLIADRLPDGEEICAQIALIDIGVIPNAQLAETLGLEVDNAIEHATVAAYPSGGTLRGIREHRRVLSVICRFIHHRCKSSSERWIAYGVITDVLDPMMSRPGKPLRVTHSRLSTRRLDREDRSCPISSD